ncbi:MAG: c-type cytochrome domain-containing protein, partial [Planctomycetaceae bacterium]
MPSGPILFLIAVTALAMCPAVTVAADSPEQFFESKVRPLLASRCFSCHRDDQKGMLTISSRESLQRGGRSGAAVVPGDPDNSLLIQAVSGTHKRLKMPPGKPLAAREISALREWIQTGAIWPESPRDFFRLRIQPVLVSECLSCHTGKPKGGLRLDSRAGLLKGGSRGPSVVAGEPRNSLLLKAIQHHGNLNMPPRKKLSDRTVADFTQWIQDGVAWDTLKIGSGSGAPTQEQQE